MGRDTFRETEYNRWCWLWTGAEEDSISMSLDTVILNESIFMEIVAETLPQVIIQITNNYYINPDIAQWGEINLASLAITIVNTLNGLWKVVYWKLMRGVNLVDIPVSFGGAHFDPISSSTTTTEEGECGDKSERVEQTLAKVANSTEIDEHHHEEGSMFVDRHYLDGKDSHTEFGVDMKTIVSENEQLKSQLINCHARIRELEEELQRIRPHIHQAV